MFSGFISEFRGCRGESRDTQQQRKDTRNKQTTVCFIGVPSGATTNKLPHKEKLSKRRNRVNDTHMLHEDRENCRKQKKRNAVVISK